MRFIVMIFGAVTLLAVGLLAGRHSLETPTVPLLPTRLPATPVNFVEQMQVTPLPYWDVTPSPMPQVTGELARGRELYQQCVHCHGDRGQGEPHNPNPNVPDQYGFMRVPRHDSLGHTWMHPDQLLVRIVQQGINNPLYRHVMPPYEAVLNEAEILLIFDYIKLWWTEEQRAQQEAATRRFELAQQPIP